MIDLPVLQRKCLIRIVDDDPQVRDSLSFLLKVKGWKAVTYESAEDFLAEERFIQPGCLILDIRMLSMSGLELQLHLERKGFCLPIIFITAHGEVDSAVHTMKHGAVDFLQKPIDHGRLDLAIRKACESDITAHEARESAKSLLRNYDSLTKREKEVLSFVAQEKTSKEIAVILGISERTVHTYRSIGMEKLQVKTVLQLATAFLRIKEARL